MALRIDLLHEMAAERTQRSRDPLKLGFLALLLLAGIFVALHLSDSAKVAGLEKTLGERERVRDSKNPASKSALEREQASQKMIDGAKLLAARSEGRFYWGPALAILLKTVPREAQIDEMNGAVSNPGGNVTITLIGATAGSEPRKIAESLRQLLRARFEESYGSADAFFSSLEDSEQTAVLDGQKWPKARFQMDITIAPKKAGESVKR